MRRFSPVMVLLPAIIGLGSACYEDSSLNPHAAQVQARVFLAGAPLPYGLIGNVEVYVVEIAASTEADTPSDTDSWSSLALPSRRFDLQQMSHGRTVMVGEVTLPVDQYRAVRVTIDCGSSIVRFGDGNEASVKWPGAGHITVDALVERPISVPYGGASIVVYFDIWKSLASDVGDPLHDFVFTPNIRAVNAAQTGSIGGTILGDADGDGLAEPIQNIAMGLLRGDRWGDPETWSAVTTGFSDSTGNYKVGFLLPGTYIVQVDAPEYTALGSLIAHDVKIVAGEDFVLSVTLPVSLAARIPSWR